MKPHRFSRTGASIKNQETNEVVHFKSKNKAKKESHKIQMREDDGLGRGTVRNLSKPRKYEVGSFNISEEQLTRMRTGK